jgi:glutathionyl-hydroquinone reductase
VRTNELHTNIVELSDIRKQKSNASSPYGPVRAGLTTSQTTLDQQLTELLSSLENVVESLNYKSFTVYDTLTTAIQGVRVALSDTATDVDGTDTI